MKKNFISIFVAEVISKVLLETEKDKALFKFIWELKINLNSLEKINPNFPINISNWTFRTTWIFTF